MVQENTQPKKDEELTGRDLPNADGTVSDEDVQAITGENDDRPIGQDHSTDRSGEEMSESGIGAIQDNNDRTSDLARIND